MRNRKPIIGIYKITNQVNGKCYIGQSHNINERWVKHIGDIAKMISGSRNTVKQILQEFDIDYESENKNRWIKKKSRSIEQYDEMKNLINIWSSTREAERELHIDHTAISDCCNYIRKSAGGYMWRYANRNEIARMADILD